MARTTTVDKATEQVAFRIASGAYPAGEKLPSVRGLATELGINPSTVQVVLGRLVATGFVEAHQGVGFIVRDVQLMGGIETWRYLFRFSQQLPDLAVRMLTDVLATRLTLVGQAVRTIAADPRGHDVAPVRRATEQLDLLLASRAGGGGAGAEDWVRFARAELHAVRLTVAAAGQGLALAVFNSVGEIFLEVPDVVRAMNQDLPIHVAFWKTFVHSWETGALTDDAITLVESAIHSWDAATVAQFRTFITEQQR